jgi:hypothetical protein
MFAEDSGKCGQRLQTQPVIHLKVKPKLGGFHYSFLGRQSGTSS